MADADVTDGIDGSEPALDLRDRVVIVTGGTRGIGLGAAVHLGRRGVRVTVTGRRPDRLAQASERLDAEGIDAVVGMAIYTGQLSLE